VVTGITAPGCANLLGESGTITAATFGGTFLGASLSCSTMTGSYIRTATVFTLSTTANSCNYNGSVSLGVTLSITGAWIPSMVSGTSGVSDSTVVASFTLQSL
jgi:hypothetical protein